mmetsp:Transcript_389/g.758  ORF Transcript_389/g.758 Transcript_389/m.758 type:complete len:333 (+) Transcript_389:192-1190(+)
MASRCSGALGQSKIMSSNFPSLVAISAKMISRVISSASTRHFKASATLLKLPTTAFSRMNCTAMQMPSGDKFMSRHSCARASPSWSSAKYWTYRMTLPASTLGLEVGDGTGAPFAGFAATCFGRAPAITVSNVSAFLCLADSPTSLSVFATSRLAFILQPFARRSRVSIITQRHRVLYLPDFCNSFIRPTMLSSITLPFGSESRVKPMVLMRSQAQSTSSSSGYFFPPGTASSFRRAWTTLVTKSLRMYRFPMKCTIARTRLRWRVISSSRAAVSSPNFSFCSGVGLAVRGSASYCSCVALSSKRCSVWGLSSSVSAGNAGYLSASTATMSP